MKFIKPYRRKPVSRILIMFLSLEGRGVGEGEYNSSFPVTLSEAKHLIPIVIPNSIGNPDPQNALSLEGRGIG